MQLQAYGYIGPLVRGRAAAPWEGEARVVVGPHLHKELAAGGLRGILHGNLIGDGQGIQRRLRAA